MRWLLVLAAIPACEKASDGRFAIGWEPPRAGEQVEIISHWEQSGVMPTPLTRDVHMLTVHTEVAGDRIVAEHKEIRAFIETGVARPQVTYELSHRGSTTEVIRADGLPLTGAERTEQTRAIEQVFADPVARKRFVLHRFKLGDPYRVPRDEVEALGMGNGEIEMTLRTAHDGHLEFDFSGSITTGNARTQVRGTLSTEGPNYRYFHMVFDGNLDAEGVHVHTHADHLQRPPSL